MIVNKIENENLTFKRGSKLEVIGDVQENGKFILVI